MFTEEQIKEKVHQQIQRDLKTGDQAGGSGHLSYVSYTLDEVHSTETEPGKWEVRYVYSVHILSEFDVATDEEEDESHDGFPLPPSSVQKTGVLFLP